MSNWLSNPVAYFFTAAFLVAVSMGSWVAAFIAVSIPVLVLVNKFLERIVPERKPEPTATELAERQLEFEKEVKAELGRIAAMSSIKNNIGMR